jgi:transposase InsO family protein
MVRSLRHTQPRHINSGRHPVINFFYHFGIPMELNSDQGHNFEYRLMQEVLERLGVSKTRTTHPHPQSGGMVERYVRQLRST